ncbi:MAG: quinone-dependent dihydroorotate dehydrogenase [Ruaniaceae bacterium]|nr:quinone-dependent dihydroorotate dehydrogenase [Ruaniaceae bacterium]
MYRTFYDKVLTHTDPEMAHHQAVTAIAAAGAIEPVRRSLKSTLGAGFGPAESTRLSVFYRPVPGTLGLAAGMDKDAKAVLGFDALGFGFVEVGTVTALPQPGNEKPRLWRHTDVRAFRNRMGFNNDGAEAAGVRLATLRGTVPGRAAFVGVNIGKSKVTALADAAEDYRASTRQVARWADYLTINVSSPNTPGLRDLQDVDALRPIVHVVREEAARVAHRDVPVIVKISPDLSSSEIADIAEMAVQERIAGICATNTTLGHDYGPGGLSGAPVKQRARDVVGLLRDRLADDQIVIGVGGIENADDARALLSAGADLLQSFTAFVYEGPSWPGAINRSLTGR